MGKEEKDGTLLIFSKFFTDLERKLFEFEDTL